MFNYFHCNGHHFTADRDVRSQNQTFRRQPYELRESGHPALAAPRKRVSDFIEKARVRPVSLGSQHAA